jgi:TolB protein
MNANGRAQRKLAPATFWPDAIHTRLAWSPDGRKLAFTTDRDGNAEVYTMNSDGSGLRRLTDNPAFDGDVAWSADGRKLAFVSDRDGSWGVYVMNPDGSGQRALTPPGT